MDSKKTRFSADSSAVFVARIKVSRAALCGKYLAFATREMTRGGRLLDLAVVDRAAAPVGRWMLRQR